MGLEKTKYPLFKEMIGKVRVCNLCGEVFTVKSQQERICLDCKQDNELYRYSEWMHEGRYDGTYGKDDLIAS